MNPLLVAGETAVTQPPDRSYLTPRLVDAYGRAQIRLGEVILTRFLPARRSILGKKKESEG